MLEVGAELRRQDHPSLVVERVLVSAEEPCHWDFAPTTLPAVPGTRLLRVPPFHTTSLHSTPLAPTRQPPSSNFSGIPRSTASVAGGRPRRRPPAAVRSVRAGAGAPAGRRSRPHGHRCDAGRPGGRGSDASGGAVGRCRRGRRRGRGGAGVERRGGTVPARVAGRRSGARPDGAAHGSASSSAATTSSRSARPGRPGPAPLSVGDTR